MDILPSIFVSHGAPTIAIQDAPARRFLAGYGDSLGRPSAIVVLSAHWLSDKPVVGGTDRPVTVHDFSGFPDALYGLDYPAPGSPALAAEVMSLLGEAGFDAARDDARGLDHGAWVPLMLMYPGADIPVLQVSIQPRLGPDHHWRLGAALAALRDRGVLVMGSGSVTHNLREYFGRGVEADPPGWVVDFAQWLAECIADRREAHLLDYRRSAPEAVRNHPTDEHLLPIFAAIGAAGPEWRGERVHASYTHGVLAMDVYEFR